jgi:hypothetical protein
MKNIAINTLKYTGIVTLSQYIGNKKIKVAQMHNNGGSPLFNFLTDCLVGDFENARLNRPTKIKLLSYNTESKAYEAVSGFITLLYPAEKVDGPAVRYSFMISKEFIASADFTNLYLGLYTSATTDVNNFAAICKLNISKTSLTNVALLVDWELAISNADSAN